MVDPCVPVFAVSREIPCMNVLACIQGISLDSLGGISRDSLGEMSLASLARSPPPGMERGVNARLSCPPIRTHPSRAMPLCIVFDHATAPGWQNACATCTRRPNGWAWTLDIALTTRSPTPSTANSFSGSRKRAYEFLSRSWQGWERSLRYTGMASFVFNLDGVGFHVGSA